MSNKEYSLEELNYFRICYISTKIVRDGLQSVFKQEWNRLYGSRRGQWLDTPSNGMDFFNMESLKSRKRNYRLLNSIRYGDSGSWDCTCLFFAILFSDSLENGSDNDCVVAVFVTGNPGCGKSQIAHQVGRKFADENPDCNSFVMTLDAESEETLLESYKRFCRELGITEYCLNNIVGGDSKLTKKEKITHLKSFAFSKVREYSAWLLILDNTNESESLRCFLSEKGEHVGCGQLLVTTQESTYLPFGDPSCKMISLSEGMQVKHAMNLLRSISHLSSGDDEEERAVLDALDYQPLAIASAALYVRFLHDGEGTDIGFASLTWESYVKQLDKGKSQATEEVYEDTKMNYPQSVTSAVSLTLQKLVKNVIFERVFQFLALCSQAPIAIDVIVKYVMEMEPDIDEFHTAAKISKCSLLIPDADNPALVRVHRVIHEVMKSHFIKKNPTDKVFEIIHQDNISVCPT